MARFELAQRTNATDSDALWFAYSLVHEATAMDPVEVLDQLRHELLRTVEAIEHRMDAIKAERENDAQMAHT